MRLKAEEVDARPPSTRDLCLFFWVVYILQPEILLEMVQRLRKIRTPSEPSRRIQLHAGRKETRTETPGQKQSKPSFLACSD